MCVCVMRLVTIILFIDSEYFEEVTFVLRGSYIFGEQNLFNTMVASLRAECNATGSYIFTICFFLHFLFGTRTFSFGAVHTSECYLLIIIDSKSNLHVRVVSLKLKSIK